MPKMVSTGRVLGDRKEEGNSSAKVVGPKFDRWNRCGARGVQKAVGNIKFCHLRERDRRPRENS